MFIIKYKTPTQSPSVWRVWPVTLGFESQQDQCPFSLSKAIYATRSSPLSFIYGHQLRLAHNLKQIVFCRGVGARQRKLCKEEGFKDFHPLNATETIDIRFLIAFNVACWLTIQSKLSIRALTCPAGQLLVSTVSDLYATLILIQSLVTGPSLLPQNEKTL